MPPRAGLALLAAAPLIFAAPTASARTARLVRPGTHERLAPGQVLEVEWPAHAVARDADEMELVLSLDGGRTFPLRVTGELPRGTTRVAWRVPAMRSSQARLALRAGKGEEEPEAEAIRATSDVFEILPGDSPSEEVLPLRGEWRTREAVELPQRGGPASSTLADDTSLDATDRLEGAGVPTRPPDRNPPREVFASSRIGASESPRPEKLGSAPPRQSPLPLRI